MSIHLFRTSLLHVKAGANITTRVFLIECIPFLFLMAQEQFLSTIFLMSQKRKNTWASDEDNSSDCSSPKPKKCKNDWLSNTSSSDITSMGESFSNTDSDDGTNNASSTNGWELCENGIDTKAKQRTENGKLCVRGSDIQSKPNSWLSEPECSELDEDDGSLPELVSSVSHTESEHGCPTSGAAATGPYVCSDGLSDVAPPQHTLVLLPRPPGHHPSVDH